MNPKIGIFATVSLFVVSSVFNVLLMYENVKVKRLFTDYIYLNTKAVDSKNSNQSVGWSENDIITAREQGKVDGKVEAILMMNKMENQLDENQIGEIIKAAETLNGKEMSADTKFISLLSQASFHKGLHSGLESMKKDIEEEYSKGYHKAIEDFSCPETGKMSVPLNLQKPNK